LTVRTGERILTAFGGRQLSNGVSKKVTRDAVVSEWLCHNKKGVLRPKEITLPICA